MTRKRLLRLYLLAALVVWVLLLGQALGQGLTLDISPVRNTREALTLRVLLGAFTLAVMLYFKRRIEGERKANFNELLWQVFMLGAFLVFLFVGLTFLTASLGWTTMPNEALFLSGFYTLVAGLLIVFMAHAFYVYKRLVLYQRSRGLRRGWRAFEITIFALLALSVIEWPVGKPPYWIAICFGGLMALLVGVNYKWVAYQNFRQKWRAILLLSLLLFIEGTLIQYLTTQGLDNGVWGLQRLPFDLSATPFFPVAVGFVAFYSLSCILVILFNLPTTSVFEQKFGEVLGFQRLNQTIIMGEREEDIYEVLLESSMATVLADAAWLEILGEDGKVRAQLERKITPEKIEQLRTVLVNNRAPVDKESVYFRNLRKVRYAESLGTSSYRSLLTIPLRTASKHLGTLILVKNVSEGFDREMVETLKTFAGQATISLENSRLIQKALENERYQEELKIAREVAQRLLPTKLPNRGSFEIHGVARTTDEVGGDYYDFHELGEGRWVFVIADVSGHGTSAAFHMAQLKGIFQSLVLMDLSPSQFVRYANRALAKCLEKKAFVTLTVLLLDERYRNIRYVRAGHCPTLFYCVNEKKVSYLGGKGLGLGILRNRDFDHYLVEEEHNFVPGDVLLLYTDGILEATDPEGEQFGEDRLREAFSELTGLPTEEISQGIIDRVEAHCGAELPHDDYSCLAIRIG